MKPLTETNQELEDFKSLRSKIEFHLKHDDYEKRIKYCKIIRYRIFTKREKIQKIDTS